MKREFIGVRLNPPGVRWLEQVAEDVSISTGSDINRLDILRSALAVAKLHESEVKAHARARL